jgi:hypothetical protein
MKTIKLLTIATPEQLARFEKWKKENHPLLEAIKRNQ